MRGRIPSGGTGMVMSKWQQGDVESGPTAPIAGPPTTVKVSRDRTLRPACAVTSEPVQARVPVACG